MSYIKSLNSKNRAVHHFLVIMLLLAGLPSMAQIIVPGLSEITIIEGTTVYVAHPTGADQRLSIPQHTTLNIISGATLTNPEYLNNVTIVFIIDNKADDELIKSKTSEKNILVNHIEKNAPEKVVEIQKSEFNFCSSTNSEPNVHASLLALKIVPRFLYYFSERYSFAIPTKNVLFANNPTSTYKVEFNSSFYSPTVWARPPPLLHS